MQANLDGTLVNLDMLVGDTAANVNAVNDAKDAALEAINEAKEDMPSSEEINGIKQDVNNIKADYNTLSEQKQDVIKDLESIRSKANSALQEHQSLDGYATEDFVNSSIATNAAYFRGTFNSVAELNAYSGAKTPNDYAFVIVYEILHGIVCKYFEMFLSRI